MTVSHVEFRGLDSWQKLPRKICRPFHIPAMMWNVPFDCVSSKLTWDETLMTDIGNIWQVYWLQYENSEKKSLRVLEFGHRIIVVCGDRRWKVYQANWKLYTCYMYNLFCASIFVCIFVINYNGLRYDIKLCK